MRARERSGDTKFKQRNSSRVMRQIPAPPPFKPGSPTEMPSSPWALISLPGELTVTVHTSKAQQSASLHLGISLNTPSPEVSSITLPNPLQSPRRFLIMAPPACSLWIYLPVYHLSPSFRNWVDFMYVQSCTSVDPILDLMLCHHHLEI